MTNPEMQSEVTEKNVVFFIADISGYTRYIVSNQKAMQHSQIIIKELLESIILEIELPLQVFKLEGDAIFLFIDKDDPNIDWNTFRKTLLQKMLTIFRVFTHKVTELTVHKICNCEACNHIEKLKLKMVIHSGKTVFFNIQNIAEQSGTDVIIVHRLLKNSITADEYILMTKSAIEDLDFSKEETEPSIESYPEIGDIQAYVYYPPEPGPYTPNPAAAYSNIFIETLREEVSQEYAQVAQAPELGFHFHTGRRLTDLLEYKDEWLADFPEDVIESFAGTGNPHMLGKIKPGEKVVDVGSGAGLDAFIVSKKVGPEGEVIGVDMTTEMVEKAKHNAAQLGISNTKFIRGYNEMLPVEDQWADVVISNGALNLSPNKEIVFSELFRVLKPGGRLQVADILISKPIPDSAKNRIDLWAG